MQLGGIDTNLVISLQALLHERNVTRAAKRVGLGQSSMSHALGRLRAHFDDPLLVPVGRHLVLTERAKALVAPVAEAIAKLEGVFLHQERFDPATSQRVFRIASTDNLGLYILPRLMPLLAKEAPGVDIRVRQLDTDWMVPLQNGDFDLKLGRKYRVPDRLHSQDLFEEQFACVVAEHHPAAKSRKLGIRQYSELRHVAVSTTIEPALTFADVVLARHGLGRRVVLTVPHFLVAPFVVASSDLALTASERLLAPFVRHLRLELLRLPMKLESYKLTQVWAQRSQDDQGHAWLRGMILRVSKSR